jgi:hypothetical protein
VSETEAGYLRNRAFVEEALDSGREPRADWREAIGDVLADLDRIVRRNAHPDDVMWARLATGTLCGIWLTVDECEALYLGDHER